MYFDHSKRNYYRFPSKNSITDMDKVAPYYFPEKSSFVIDDINDSFLNSSHYEDSSDSSLQMKGD
jgi:hypothetical protein